MLHTSALVGGGMADPGTTFYACLLVLVRLRPLSFVFENVPGLVETGQLECARLKCVEAGYVFIWWWGNPLRLGGPHDRDRVWMAGWPVSSKPEQIADAFGKVMSKLVEDLYIDHPVSDIDSFLFKGEGADAEYLESKHNELFLKCPAALMFEVYVRTELSLGTPASRAWGLEHGARSLGVGFCNIGHGHLET